MKSTVDDALKFVPFTVKAKLIPPTVTETGLIEVVVGTGLLTVSVWVLDVPPPGTGLTTAIESVPPTAI